VPDQLTEDKINITTTIHKVMECGSLPSEFEKTEAPTFYGKIHLGDDLTSIVGMSGGPLLSFKRTESGELKYWLCGTEQMN